MEKSLFIKWIADSFQAVITKTVEKINGKKNSPVYLHETMLKKEFSPTMRWGSLTSNGTTVAADIVSLDSSLPLKKRDSIAKVEGDIPKMGMALALNERQMNDLILLEQTQGQEKQLLTKLFDDAVKVVFGIKEANEMLFLQALSSGVALRTDGASPGTGIRIDYKHPDENKFGVLAPWSSTSAKPIDDIENVLARAKENGDSPSVMLMDKTSWNNMRNKSQVKEFYAMHAGWVGSNIASPTLEKFNEAIQSEYGLTIIIIDRVVKTEKSGVRTNVRPWAENAVTFLNGISDLGTLTWGTLAEMKFKSEKVTYATVDDYILVSKFHETNPIKEITSSQALVVPVLDNVDSIYIMNTADAVTDTQTESDANFDYEGTSYTRASVILGINTAKEETVANSNMTDAQLLDIINQLSDAEIEVFELELVESV